MSKPARVKCPQCTYSVTNAGSLPAHVAMAHPVAAATPSGEAMTVTALIEAMPPLTPTAAELKLKETLDGLDQAFAAVAADNERLFPATDTREAWMLRAVELMRPLFAEIGEEVPPVRISIGWPGGRGNKQHVVGQCWAASAVADKVPAIFVSPVQKDVLEILGTIMHECIHACAHFAHRADFAKVAKKLDPEGDHTGSWAKSWPLLGRSPALFTRLQSLADQLGEFPHSAVRGEGGLLGTGPARPAVQGTRMIKCWCASCGYTLRTTRQWRNIATPVCPNSDSHGSGLEMEVEDK